MAPHSTMSAIPHHARDPHRHDWEIHGLWLSNLRWVAVVGQLVTIGFVAEVLRVPLPVRPLLTVVGVTAATNAAFVLFLRFVRAHPDSTRLAAWGQSLLVVVAALDLMALTVLLYLTGGAANPFALFYLVNLALSAVILPSQWAWILGLAACLCFAYLHSAHYELPELDRTETWLSHWIARPISLQTQGQLVALATCAGVITYFVTRVTGELHRRNAELRAAERLRARGEKLESLGTLAAGAAHELASPLSTIAVVAKELERRLQDLPDQAPLLDDARLIRSELDHCRAILDRMAGHAGQAVGEPVVYLAVEQMVEDVVSVLRRQDRVRRRLDTEAASARISVPRESIAQSIRGLVQNALDATDPDGEVELRAQVADQLLRIQVVDHGPGMPDHVLSRAGEPFFTTKEPGQGMGLGLFLARSVVERLDGSVRLDSTPGHGVTAVVTLPIALEATDPDPSDTEHAP